VVNIRGLSYRWPGRGGFTLAVPELTLTRGETVLLLGESGSGKSTLLSLICGALEPNSGQIEIDGENIVSMRPAARDRFRAEKIGVIFQQLNLLSFGRVIDNISLPLHFAPLRRKRAGRAPETAKKLMLDLGLPAEMLNERASTLSVGQQQRVAVARALIGAPPLVVADEPTSALDAATQSTFLSLLFHQVRTNHSALLMVSHDERLVPHFDRAIHMADIASAAVEQT